MTDEMIESSSLTSWSCPDCGGRLLHSQGYIVCSECGISISRKFVNPTSQMREPKRSDAPDATMYVSLGNRMHIVDGLGSLIGFHKDWYSRDAHGRFRSATTSEKRFKRLKSIYRTQVRAGSNEAKYRAQRTLKHVSKLLMLNEQVRDRTAYLYKKVVSESYGKVTNNIPVLAACLLITANEFEDGAPITLEEIANVFEKCGHRVSVRSIVREALRLMLSRNADIE